MNYQASFRAFILLVFILLGSPALAEYKAITKLPNCMQSGDKHGCDDIDSPEELEKTLPLGVDETDIKACEAITDNINEMEKYHVNWNCDFPISANNYLLSKPQWTEVVGEEKARALDTHYRSYPGWPSVYFQKLVEEERRPVYGVPYNLDTTDADEKIYEMPTKIDCKAGNTITRTSFWLAENDGSSLVDRYGKSSQFDILNDDIVFYASRVYFVRYYGEEESSTITGFNVTTLRIPYASKGGLKTVGAVCSIKSAETLNPTKEK